MVSGFLRFRARVPKGPLIGPRQTCVKRPAPAVSRGDLVQRLLSDLFAHDKGPVNLCQEGSRPACSVAATARFSASVVGP
jgi:hypothetical protein